MKLLSLDKKYIKKCFYILFCPRLFVTLHIEIKKKITMQIKETPVLLLTGYLGSGKTTLDTTQSHFQYKVLSKR